ncbi:MAG: sugar dehydrogenase complex small subunit [Burkholderiales bacterium]
MTDAALSPAAAGRRLLLQGLAALVAAGAAPLAAAQGAPTPAQFAALTRTLTGYAWQDDVAAAAMLRTLSTAVGASTLARVADLARGTAPDALSAALATAGLERAASTIVTALYTGVVETPKGPVVLTYASAIAWQAVPWTKPNALCGGITDYWASAPGQSS